MKQKPFTSGIVKTALRCAKAEREDSDAPFYKIGAVIFNGKRVLVAGHNKDKTDPRQIVYNKYRPFDSTNTVPKLHAEICTLLKLKKTYPELRPKDLAILVYRETKSGEYAIAKPCAACERALRDYGITDIYYTGQNSLVYEKYLGGE